MAAPSILQAANGTASILAGGDLNFEVSLPAPTTAGTTVIICLYAGSPLNPDPPVGFESLFVIPGTSFKHYWLRRANVAAGEQSWTLTVGVAGGPMIWRVWEYNNLHPSAPLAASAHNGPTAGQRTSWSTGTTGTPAAVETLSLACHGWARAGTAPTQVVDFHSHTNGFTEDAELDAIVGQVHIQGSFSSKVTEDVGGPYETTASITHSAPHNDDIYLASIITLLADTTLPPVISRRIDYNDDTSYSDPAPPTRLTDVLAIVYWHDYPYRTLHYGQEMYAVDGVILSGGLHPGGDVGWEAYRQGLHAEPHPDAP